MVRLTLNMIRERTMFSINRTLFSVEYVLLYSIFTTVAYLHVWEALQCLLTQHIERFESDSHIKCGRQVLRRERRYLELWYHLVFTVNLFFTILFARLRWFVTPTIKHNDKNSSPQYWRTIRLFDSPSIKPGNIYCSLLAHDYPNSKHGKRNTPPPNRRNYAASYDNTEQSQASDTTRQRVDAESSIAHKRPTVNKQGWVTASVDAPTSASVNQSIKCGCFYASDHVKKVTQPFDYQHRERRRKVNFRHQKLVLKIQVVMTTACIK